MPKWRDYQKLGRTRRSTLAKRAANNPAKRKELISYSRSIRSAVNYRLKTLRKAGFDYGSAYNNFMHYIDTQYDTNLAPPISSFESIAELAEFNEYAIKFLKSHESTITGQSEMAKARVNVLREHEVLPYQVLDKGGYFRDSNYRDFDDFLRFLGTEEVVTSIDEYGTSEVVVDFLWNEWEDHRDDVDNMFMLKVALAQFNAGNISFNELVEERGKKLEDYLVRYRKHHDIQ